MSKPAPAPEQLSLFATLVGGLLSGSRGGPAARNELAEPFQGPPGLELADDVDKVFVRVQPEQQTAIDQREGSRQALAATRRAGEEEVAACDGKGPDSSFDAPAVDLEAPVGEAAPEEFALIDRVGRRTPERRLGQEPRVDLVYPTIQSVEQRQQRRRRSSPRAAASSPRFLQSSSTE
jgi:hypothetical protein